MRHRIDYTGYEGMTKDQKRMFERRELERWPILSAPFTPAEIRNLSNMDLRQLLWVTKALVDIDDDMEGRDIDLGDEAFQISLRQFVYREDTDVAESMAETALQPFLLQLKAKEYIPSYGFGLSGRERVVYIGSAANMVAVGELWTYLMEEWQHRNKQKEKPFPVPTEKNIQELLVNKFKRGRKKIMSLLVQHAEIWKSGSQIQKGRAVNRHELQAAGSYSSERAFREALQDMRKELRGYTKTKIEIRNETTNQYSLVITF
ncbi:MAG: hypothetical protein Q7S32_01255 [bacterium]|nr:hypothetical protein [bacterium]